jgi:hypothetical protein
MFKYFAQNIKFGGESQEKNSSYKAAGEASQLKHHFVNSAVSLCDEPVVFNYFKTGETKYFYFSLISIPL